VGSAILRWYGDSILWPLLALWALFIFDIFISLLKPDMNPFTDQYKKLSNSELLWIVNNPDDYQLLAIDAAKTELASRQLTLEEMTIAENEVKVRHNAERAKTEKDLALKNILKKTMNSMADIIKRPAPKYKIKVILSIILSLIFLFQAFSRIDLLKFMLTYNDARWDLPTVFLFIPWLTIIIGLLLFWFHKKAGWIVLSAYIAYEACYSTIEFFVWTFQDYPESPLLKRAISPMTYLPSLFFLALFFSGMLWAICRGDIRSDYHISRKSSLQTIVFSFIATALLCWLHLV